MMTRGGAGPADIPGRRGKMRYDAGVQQTTYERVVHLSYHAARPVLRVDCAIFRRIYLGAWNVGCGKQGEEGADRKFARPRRDNGVKLGRVAYPCLIIPIL